jgi:hypothetical protein
MWNDPFHLCDRVTPWYPYTNEWSAESITVSTNYVLEGTSSLCMAYNVPSVDQNRAVFTCPTNEMWVLRVDRTLTNDPPTKGINRVKFFWNVISPDHDVQVSLALRGTTENIYAESVSQTVLAGSWSNVMFDLSAGDWKWAGSGWSHSSYLLDITNSATGTNILEDVNEVSLIVYDLPVGSGEVYVDDIQIKRDDGFVVYADDPVCPVIQAHAARMGARNIATNRANNAPAVNDLVVEVASFVATNINISATDLDGDFLSYRLMSKPTNGWVYGVPPSNLVYKTQPGVGVVNDTFTYVAHDDLCDSRVATVMLTVVNNDIDDDDLPDDWEYTYFPKRVQWWPDSEEDKLTNMLYQWDWDGDGYSDGWEYYAGTDPTNSASYLWIDGAAAVGDSGWILEWPSVADRTYILERSTNLLDGFTALVTNAATPPQNVYTDTTASVESTCIYRVKVE